MRPSDCADIDVLNTLDGFNMQPRISIPFTGPIDPSSVNSSNVFLISLPDFKVTGINQIAWEPAAEHTARRVRPAAPASTPPTSSSSPPAFETQPVSAIQSAFFRPAHAPATCPISCAGLPGELHLLRCRRRQRSSRPRAPRRYCEKVRRTRSTRLNPAAANFVIGNGGERTVFPLAGVSVDSLLAPDWHRADLRCLAGDGNSVPGRSRLGRASAPSTRPDYETASKVIPAVGTCIGAPHVQGTNRLYFNLFLPAGTAPAGGWPVAIYGHGFTRQQEPEPVHRRRVRWHRRGIATIAINVAVGHGGPARSARWSSTAPPVAPVVLPAGGRGLIRTSTETAIDLDRGRQRCCATADADLRAATACARRLIDLMQLVREIEVGVDVDGDGVARPRPVADLVLRPVVRRHLRRQVPRRRAGRQAGVPNVPGGAIIEIARLSPAFRGLVTPQPRSTARRR